MHTVAVFEDEADLFALLKYTFENEGFQTVGLTTGAGAVELCRRARPDVAVIDINLPAQDGFTICKEIRSDPLLSRTPVIFLTARIGEADRVLGLEIGGNDYVVKPFSTRELVARVKVQLRSKPELREVLKGGPVDLDRTRRRVYRAGQPVELTATEFRLLEYLMDHPGAVFSREQLLDAVWGPGRAVTDRAVDVYVLRLRRKLEVDPERPELIHSTRGFGYSFEASPAAARRYDSAAC